MSYKLGYIADRVGVPSKTLQTEALLSDGILEHDIYNNLDDCLKSVRKGDTVYVYTTALFGRNKLNETFLWAAENDAAGIYSIKTKRFYDCQDNITGMEVLHDAWEELNQVTRQQIGAVGKQLGGRKPDPIWKHQPAIVEDFKKGVTKKELAETYGKYGKGGTIHESTITRILKANREKK